MNLRLNRRYTVCLGLSVTLLHCVMDVPQATAQSRWNPVVAAPVYANRPDTMQSLRRTALVLANRDRARYGLRTLLEDKLLNRAAQLHAEDMLRRNYFSHISPEGRSPSDRFAAVGGRGGAAENLAALKDPRLASAVVGTAQLNFFERQWMNSPGHRRNLLDSRFGRFGFGLAKAGDRIYAVQLFTFAQ
ncbi:MAG TPA: CAP domain-containing protein [Stenomitos sp.]